MKLLSYVGNRIALFRNPLNPVSARMAATSPAYGSPDELANMDVKEGFLCPMCFQDLQSFHNLQSHFETAHSTEDKAMMSQIRGLFSKAKDKLLGKDYEDNDPRDPFASSPPSSSMRSQSFQREVDPALWEPQELGVTRCHMDKLKAIRDARIDRVVIETNKIIIRLDKLLKPISMTGKRNDKAFEQTLVPWVQDDDVPFCPTCGDKFNVARRKHHCRLCGAIMCTKCSIFLPFQVAEELVKSIKSVTQPSLSKKPGASVRPEHLMTDEESQRINVRICFECDKVLLRNKEKMNRLHNPTLLVLLYEKMRKAMDAAIKLAPEFQKMAVSLNNGEEEYKLDIATQKRFQLTQMFEAIDVISKKIAAFDTQDEDNPPTSGALRLQTAIRRAAHTFLQENMLSLPSLPSQPKLQVLQARRRAENESRLRKQREEAQRLREEEKRRQEIEMLKRERELAEEARRLEQAQKNSVQYSTTNTQDRPSLLMFKDPGWSADKVSITSNTSRHSKMSFTSDTDEDDADTQTSSTSAKEDPLGPLLEQIEYVKESAKQAHAAGMQAEAESLERNMDELKQEYRRQRTARAFAVTPTTPVPHKTIKNSALNSPQRTFSPSIKLRNDTGEDPLLQQIHYISKCIDEAKSANKFDEARILSENLQELKDIYSQSKLR